MAQKLYNVSRENAAKYLGISTRTIDRYIRSWKVSYKKIANKVMLAKEEIDILKNEFDMLHQEINPEVYSADNIVSVSPQKTAWSDFQSSMSFRSELEASIDQKIERFFHIFNEKEKTLEEKNKIIFMLQQRVWELENKIQHMVALPDYTSEKQKLLIEKEKLENKIRELSGTVKNEKLKNIIYLWFLMIIVFALIVFVGVNNN